MYVTCLKGGNVMKKSLTVMLCVFFLMGGGVASAQLALFDNHGENIGPVDLLEAQAEVYNRKVDGGSSTEALLKLTIKTEPNLPGVVIFESDLDNNTGTGGAFGTIGAPVPPCDSCGCKCTPGLDIAVSIYHRTQGATSGSAFCGGCVDGNTNSCQVERKGGEWYAVTAIDGQPLKALGFLRGYSDPTPGVIGGTPVQTSYTLPWRDIIVWANARISGQAGAFNMTKATDYVTNNKWQVSIWYDANYATDRDDITTSTGPGPLDVKFDINDWAPDGDGNMADILPPGFRTYCEGNFDQDADVDGGDAALFKSNFGRSSFKNPCPDANAYY